MMLCKRFSRQKTPQRHQVHNENLKKYLEKLLNYFLGKILEAGHMKRYWYLITTSSFPALGMEPDETALHMSEKLRERTLSFQRQTT